MKKAAETIISCLAEKGMSQSQLAEIMGEDRRNINQQLMRNNDFKLERFVDILDYIGYKVEIVDNGGIRKVSPEYARKIIEERELEGLFWTFEDGVYTGICSKGKKDEMLVEKFDTKDSCFLWLNGKTCTNLYGKQLNGFAGTSV